MGERIYRWHENFLWLKFFGNPNLKLFWSRLLCSVLIWLENPLISRVREAREVPDLPGSLFNFILRLLRLSPTARERLGLALALVFLRSSTKFTRFNSFDFSLLFAEFSVWREPFWISLLEVIELLLSSVFKMNSSDPVVFSSNAGSSINSIS